MNRSLVGVAAAVVCLLGVSTALAQCSCGTAQVTYAPVAADYTTYYAPTVAYYAPTPQVSYYAPATSCAVVCVVLVLRVLLRSDAPGNLLRAGRVLCVLFRSDAPGSVLRAPGSVLRPDDVLCVLLHTGDVVRVVLRPRGTALRVVLHALRVLRCARIEHLRDRESLRAGRARAKRRACDNAVADRQTCRSLRVQSGSDGNPKRKALLWLPRDSTRLTANASSVKSELLSMHAVANCARRSIMQISSLAV